MIKDMGFYAGANGLVLSGVATDITGILRVSECCEKTARSCVWDIGCFGTPYNEYFWFNICLDERYPLPRNIVNLFLDNGTPLFVRWAKVIFIHAKFLHAKVVRFIFVPSRAITHGSPPNVTVHPAEERRGPHQRGQARFKSPHHHEILPQPIQS